MKRFPVLIIIGGTIFLASLFVIVYAVLQISSGKEKVTQNLVEWENVKRSLSQEDVILADQLVEGNTTLESIMYEQGEVIGKLTIPKLNRELPIIYGTDEQELERGVGHYIGSALPGENNQMVLAGHRDTVFVGLGDIDVGDKIEVETIDGTYIYEIYHLDVVERDDKTVIVPHSEPVVTLITCYPFNFIGPAPQRYIISGKLVN